jgi:hypothetical protein
VRRDADSEQEIAGRTAGRAGLSLSAQANGPAVLHAGRDLHIDPFGIFAATDLQPMIAPLGGHLKGDRDLERYVFAFSRLAGGLGMSKVRLARRARAEASREGTGAALELRSTPAEELIEEVAQIDGMRAIGPGCPSGSVRAATAAAVEGVAVAIVLNAFVRVAQDGVGLLDLFELIGGVFVTRANVRVILARELLVGLANFFSRGAAINAQRLVIVDFCHRRMPRPGRCGASL